MADVSKPQVPTGVHRKSLPRVALATGGHVHRATDTGELLVAIGRSQAAEELAPYLGAKLSGASFSALERSAWNPNRIKCPPPTSWCPVPGALTCPSASSSSGHHRLWTPASASPTPA